MQRILRQSGDEGVMEEARALLEENGYSQQITVECLAARATGLAAASQ